MSLPLHIQTPTVFSQQLYNKWRQNVYFKLEALQPSGSFKLRGIGQLCQKYALEGYQSLVASSGGNAGIAAAYCGMKLKLPTTIYIPETSHPIYVDVLKKFHANVIVAGKNVGEAQEQAMQQARKTEAAYIHPYDHPEIWQGHSTMIDEIVLENIKPDVIILSVGGGGLACGVLEGMHRHGWTIPLITVETEGADVFAQSIKMKKSIQLSNITSRATSLGATYAAPQLMAWSKQHLIYPVVVSDEIAEKATHSFAKEMRILVEIASGASLSLAYEHHPLIQNYQNVLIIVCGGVNISHFYHGV